MKGNKCGNILWCSMREKEKDGIQFSFLWWCTVSFLSQHRINPLRRCRRRSAYEIIAQLLYKLLPPAIVRKYGRWYRMSLVRYDCSLMGRTTREPSCTTYTCSPNPPVTHVIYDVSMLIQSIPFTKHLYTHDSRPFRQPIGKARFTDSFARASNAIGNPSNVYNNPIFVFQPTIPIRITH